MFYRIVATCKISAAVLFNMLATSRSCGNIHCFVRNYQPGKITLQVSVLIINYVVAIF